jgi:tetratricopeptide (TPR) repeat protein
MERLNGDRIEMTADEVEAALVRELEACGWSDRDALIRLLIFCNRTGRLDRVPEALSRLYEMAGDGEGRAEIMLWFGQHMEKRADYHAAETYYRSALAMRSENPAVQYFANNNLGYSLNQLGRFEEAMPYLEEAVRIEPRRSNAFKNRGLALQGLGKYEKAVEQFVEATRAYAADGRSLRYLEELLNEHPELYDTVPSIEWMLGECRRAVAQARAARSLVH